MKLKWRMLLTIARDRLERSTEDHLRYIHIGKCGGSTLQKAMENSPVLAERFSAIRHIHTRRPIYKAKNQYVFVLRNPIDRAMSAFNWRFHLLIESERKKDSRPGEVDALTRYQTLNALAEALYKGETLNARAAEDYRSIQHLRQDIAYYLDPLLPNLRADQIFAVLCQHRLDQDIATYFGVENTSNVNVHSKGVDRARLHLSDLGRHNLRRFLDPEYLCIERLCTLFPLDDVDMAVLRRA